MLLKYLNKIPALILLVTCVALPMIGLAEEAAVSPNAAPEGDDYNIIRYVLTGVLVLLLCIIVILGNALRSAGKLYWERSKERKNSPGPGVIMLLVFLLTGGSHVTNAEEVTEAVATPVIGLPADIVILLIVAALEFTVVLLLAKMLLQFLDVKANQEKANSRSKFKLSFRKLNQTVSIDEEYLLDMNHDYDGIRELDNKIPAWWRYAFYSTILFSVVYLYRMFVNENLPDQFRELAAANKIAAIQREEYLKNAANNIDENNVAMLDAAGIAAGQALFVKNCQACHGDKGQGGVGPNLTDEYWLHKGSLKDIFYSIKYGWPEKGMKSWKDDLSPLQTAQVASFIKSLQGTNPPGGKDAQGVLYTEEAGTATGNDTTAAKAN